MNKSVNKSYLRQSVDIIINALPVSDFANVRNFYMSISRRQFSGLTVAAAASLALSSVPALAGSKRKGSLSGRKGYSVQGTVKVKKEGGSTKVVFSDDYLFDPSKNPPDIKICLLYTSPSPRD